MQAVRRKVTMVFQNGALFDSLSVGENVAFPLRERKELVEDQIQQIVNGLLEMVDSRIDRSASIRPFNGDETIRRYR